MPRDAVARTKAPSQAELREKWRRESVLDRRIRLGLPSAPPWVDVGLTVFAYYRNKYRDGRQDARFYGLHLIEGYGRKSS